MRLPPDLQREFEILLQQPPMKTRAVRKQLSERMETAHSGSLGSSELLRECERSLTGMLGIIQRKTTPLYVRLIHSAVSYFCACVEDGTPEALEKAAAVIDSVAATTKREAFRISRA